jgi:hypothetical protein
MYLSDHSKNLISAEEKVAELIKQRDQLRAEVERLGRATTNGQVNWMQESDRQNARAERAEASLHALRLVCGTTDADKFTTWVDRANARAERAEAELAAAKLLLNEETDCAEAVEAAIVRQYARAERAEAELAAERARLDDLVSVNATGAARLAHATAQLAAEREKVRALRLACERIVAEWDDAHDTNPIGAGGWMYSLASKALGSTEDTKT